MVKLNQNNKRKKKTSNNRFILIFENFKSDQPFVGKTKLANNFYVENLNHFS